MGFLEDIQGFFTDAAEFLDPSGAAKSTRLKNEGNQANAQLSQQQREYNADVMAQQKALRDRNQGLTGSMTDLYSKMQGQKNYKSPTYDMQGALSGANTYAQKQAQDQARMAGQGISRQAQTASRTAGLNPGQAAAMGSRAGSDAYGQQYLGAYNNQQQQYLGQAGQQYAANMAGQQFQNQQTQQNLQNLLANLGLQNQNYAVSTGGLTPNFSQSPAPDNSQEMGALAGVIGAIASDENVKDDIKKESILEPVGKHVRQISYTYKGSDHPEMVIYAQDLEKTPLKSVVMDTPQGKMVDTRRLSTANTGMIADLSRKVDKILDFYKKAS